MEQEILNLQQEVGRLRSELEQFKVSLREQLHNGVDGRAVDFGFLDGLINVVTSATDLTTRTAGVAHTVSEQIFIDTTTGTKKLYIYDQVGNVWRSCTIA